MKLSPFLLLLFFLFSLSLEAQIRLPFSSKVEVEFLDANLNEEDTSIVIRYNLNGSRRRYYKTQLYYSNNGGNSYKGPLRSLEGDMSDSTRSGKEKTVAWSFRKDNPYFDGKNIVFRIIATEVPKISRGGPENAFRSLLVPGLGDTKVRNGYNYGIITAVTYASLGTGLYFHFRSRNKYDDYTSRIANSEEDHRNLYNQAQRSRNLAQGFLITGGAIWLADIIGVYARGLKNRRQISKENEKRSEEEVGSRGIPLIIPSVQGKAGSLTLLWRF